MNRFGTKLCSIVLCTSMLGTTMLGSGIPSASAEGLFGGASLSERLQSRETGEGSVLDRLGKAADRFAEGREERQDRAEAFLEDARSAAEEFRENHPELAAGAEEARETLREAADGLRENLEERGQEIGSAAGTADFGSGEELPSTDSVQNENGETPATERVVLDVTKRIEERRAEREARMNRLQDGLESVITQIDEKRSEAEERAASVRDELETGIAKRTASSSLLAEGNTEGQSGTEPGGTEPGGTEPGGSSSVLDNLRERIEEIRQQLEQNRDDWAQPEEKLEELKTRVEEIRAALEEAASSEDGGNSRVEELKKQLRDMEQKIQQAKEELAEKTTVFWKLKNWIAHPEAMLFFRMLQRLSAPREHKSVQRAQRDTSATGAANYQPVAGTAVSPSPSPSPSPLPTPQPAVKNTPVIKQEEIEEEEVPLALPEPVPMKVTPWYLKPEFIIAMCAVVGLGCISAVSALRAGTASTGRKKKSGQPA